MIINTDNYIKTYINCFDQHILKDTIQELNSLKTLNKRISEGVNNFYWEPHSWYDPKEKIIEIKKNGKQPESTKKIVKYHNNIMATLHKYIGNYINDLKDKHLTGWSGYTQILFHRYNKGTKMNKHIDHITSIFEDRKGVPILSVVGQLNDDFNGGEFVILDKTIKMKAGDILIFPSNFIFEHEVKKITKGTRLSFISWVY
jgi:predicted 2-oxoglutarate/Fe(II)-dependent dioxygenase YbiX